MITEICKLVQMLSYEHKLNNLFTQAEIYSKIK